MRLQVLAVLTYLLFLYEEGNIFLFLNSKLFYFMFKLSKKPINYVFVLFSSIEALTLALETHSTFIIIMLFSFFMFSSRMMGKIFVHLTPLKSLFQSK